MHERYEPEHTLRMHNIIVLVVMARQGMYLKYAQASSSLKVELGNENGEVDLPGVVVDGSRDHSEVLVDHPRRFREMRYIECFYYSVLITFTGSLQMWKMCAKC